MRSDRRKTSVEWPAAVDDRLRHLVQLAEGSSGLRTTSASELLAALICVQPLDGDHPTGHQPSLPPCRLAGPSVAVSQPGLTFFPATPRLRAQPTC